MTGWDVDQVTRFFSNDVQDVYGQAVNPPTKHSRGHTTIEKCRAIARYRMLLGTKKRQQCTACLVVGSGEVMVECDDCNKWYHPHCQDTRMYELGTFWRCRRCLDARPPQPPSPTAPYAPPIVGSNQPWYKELVQKQFEL